MHFQIVHCLDEFPQISIFNTNSGQNLIGRISMILATFVNK